MFPSIFKELLAICTKTPKNHFHQYPSLKSFATLQTLTNPDVSLMDYLKVSCGLSSDKALSVSKTLQNKTLQHADSVLTFLKENGFSKTRIASIIAKRPDLLRVRVESTLTPKIEFLTENGLSQSEIVDVLSSNPALLFVNLDKRVKPLFDFILSVSDKNVSIKDMFRHYSCMLTFNLEKKVVANVNNLKKYGVPVSRISRLLIAGPRTLNTNVDRFSENLKVVVKMGFKPPTHLFMEAVRAMATMSKSTWKAKFEVYKRLGWSEEEIVLAFRRHPSSIMISKEKIKKGMDFFVKELGWGPSVICIYPNLLLFSLEQKITPRLMVLRALESKGLVKKGMKRVYSFKVSEKCFLEKFVRKHQKEFPEILKIYKGGLDGQLRPWAQNLIASAKKVKMEYKRFLWKFLCFHLNSVSTQRQN